MELLCKRGRKQGNSREWRRRLLTARDSVSRSRAPCWMLLKKKEKKKKSCRPGTPRSAWERPGAPGNVQLSCEQSIPMHVAQQDRIRSAEKARFNQSGSLLRDCAWHAPLCGQQQTSIVASGASPLANFGGPCSALVLHARRAYQSIVERKLPNVPQLRSDATKTATCPSHLGPSLASSSLARLPTPEARHAPLSTPYYGSTSTLGCRGALRQHLWLGPRLLEAVPEEPGHRPGLARLGGAGRARAGAGVADSAPGRRAGAACNVTGAAGQEGRRRG
eukprot:scaffold8014_cov248-Pinguiococcus_pyrenoidosus.AAC.6